jgi:hypothetical protein
MIEKLQRDIDDGDYDEFKEKNDDDDMFFSSTNYLNLSTIWPCWSESPEVQLFEHILNYVYEKNFNSNAIEKCVFVDVLHDRGIIFENNLNINKKYDYLGNVI